MSPRVVSASAMFGIGICVGLFLSLAIHLPAPGSVSGDSSLAHPRAARHLRSIQPIANNTIVLRRPLQNEIQNETFAKHLDIPPKPTGEPDEPAPEKIDSYVVVKLSKNKPDEPTDSQTSTSNNNSHPAKGGVWPTWVEDFIPTGFKPDASEDWRKKLSQRRVVNVSPGCGRGQNRLLTLDDATKACARYRMNLEQVQGEVFSGLLGQMLEIGNIPPLAAIVVRFEDNFWSPVREDLAAAGWAEDNIALLTPWVHGLASAGFPEEIRPGNKAEVAIPAATAPASEINKLSELAQWSDLVLFDFLTGNVDRAVNNLFNQQWNPSSLEGPTHNLERTKDGLLVFLDNESGLLHSFRLLDKYAPLHDQLLERVCVFRQRTVTRLADLSGKDAGEELWQRHQTDPSHPWIPRLPRRHAKTLQTRISLVMEHVRRCGVQS